MANIIVKNYEHYNRTMGCYVKSRSDYEKKMRDNGYVSWEEGERLAAEAKKRMHKPYDKLSDKAMSVCLAAKNMADKEGNIKAGSRLMDAMKKCGVSFNKEIPKDLKERGF